MENDAPDKDMEHKESEEIKYFGQSVEIPFIERNSYVGVGGHILKDGLHIKLFVDSDNIDSVIEEMQVVSAETDRARMGDLLESDGISVDAGLYAPIFAFVKAYNKRFGNPSDSSKRDEAYRKGIPILSTLLSENMAMCAEIAVLAQLYLQSEGIDSSYFGGEVLWLNDIECPESHSFIYLNHENQEYIFDPSNSYNCGIVMMPMLREIKNFKNEISKNRKIFVESRDVLRKSPKFSSFPSVSVPSFYGTGNRASAFEKHLIRYDNQPVKEIKGM